MSKRRKISTSEKAYKDAQQNGSADCGNGAVSEKGGSGQAVQRPESRLRRTESRAARDGSSSSSGPAVSSTSSIQEAKSGPTGSSSTEGAPALLPPPAPPQPIRSSSRVPKRPRRDNTPPAPSPPKKSLTKAEKAAAAAEKGTPEAKSRRQWELWSSYDKDAFFDALNEHGKDFDAIQNVIAQRQKKRPTQSAIRTKEQVRHFYYRTWHKIAKFVEVKEDVSKHAMELYGLINFGEFRKRVGGVLNDKSGIKLNELVHKGLTVVKLKGKNFRVKTPVCRVLKKLNNVDDNEVEAIPIPKQLTLELRPSSNAAWATVQAISHNPRLRIHLPSNKRLSGVVDFLNKKWKSHRLRTKESMNATEEMTKELVLTPPPTCELYPYNVTPVTGETLGGLDKLKESVKDTRSPAIKRVKRSTGTEVTEEQQSKDSNPSNEDPTTSQTDAEAQANNAGAKVNGTTNSTKTTSVTDSVQSNTSTPAPATNGETVEQPGTSSIQDKSKETPQKPDTPSPESLAAGGQLVITLENDEEKDAKDTDGDKAKDSLPETKEERKAREEVIRKERIEKLRQGWNLKAAQGITIGELYLLMGCPEKLMLEYNWVDIVKTDNVVQMNTSLTNMLRRLVQLASTEFSDFNKAKPPAGVEVTPTKTCNCGGQMMTPPGRNAKNSRASGGSTPKGAKPVATVSKISTGTQVPEPNQSGPGSTSPVLASGPAGDGVFRVPKPVPQRPQQSPVNNILQQIHQATAIPPNFLMPPKKQKKLMTRNLRRQPMVVQRSLLPKPGIADRQLMKCTILPNQSTAVAQTGSFMPLVPGQVLQAQVPVPVAVAGVGKPPARVVVSQPTPTTQATPTIQMPTVTVASPADLNLGGIAVVAKPNGTQSLLAQAASAAGISSEECESDLPSTESQQPDSTSSPNLSAMLDISLPSIAGIESNDGATNDSMSFLNNFSGLLDNSVSGRVTVDVNEDSMSLPVSASSPNKSFKLNSTLGPDGQWNNGEDFSLSQFLPESPMKRSSNDPMLINEGSRDSIRCDVDTALQCMMNENSMDFAGKFADLATQIASQAPEMSKYTASTSTPGISQSGAPLDT